MREREKGRNKGWGCTQHYLVTEVQNLLFVKPLTDFDRWRIVFASTFYFDSYGSPASPFFACTQLRDKRCCWLFEKKRPSFFKESCLALWSCASLHPPHAAVELYPVLSLCLVCWARSERFAVLLIPSAICTRAWFWSLFFDWTHLLEFCHAGEAWRFDSVLENWWCNTASYMPYVCLWFGALYGFFLMTGLWDNF